VAPIFIAALSLAGLLSALLLSEIGRYFSWIAIGFPVVVSLFAFVQYIFRRNRIDPAKEPRSGLLRCRIFAAQNHVVGFQGFRQNAD
jgi:hypothetical protein